MTLPTGTKLSHYEITSQIGKGGMGEVYQAKDQNFIQWDGKYTVQDEQGMRWQLDEAQLKATDGRVLHRLPAHRAFWFGWFSAYSHTRLVQ